MTALRRTCEGYRSYLRCRYDCDCGEYNGPPKVCSAVVGMENVSRLWENYKCSASEPKWECWRGNTGKKMGGLWYSTIDSGYCGDGSEPAPPGCQWRVAEFVKRVNKSCSDNVIYGEVESVGSSCFNSCQDSGVGNERNLSSTCWISCFYDSGKCSTATVNVLQHV